MSAIQNDAIRFATFFLEGQVFGVDILRMREVIRPVEITKVPPAESFVEGVINLRGVVIPVISLRALFDMPAKPLGKETRIINMEIDAMVVGFIVDSIGHGYSVPANAIKPAPAVAAAVDVEYIAGIANVDDTLLVILDVDKLVAMEILQEFAQK